MISFFFSGAGLNPPRVDSSSFGFKFVGHGRDPCLMECGGTRKRGRCPFVWGAEAAAK